MSENNTNIASINTNENPLNFYNVLKTQLLKIFNDFIREIDISFDYINKNHLNKIKKTIDICYTNDIKFKEFYNTVYNTLHNVKDKLYLPKIKSSELLFLNNVTLFDISFELFKDEGKNTKKTLVNYLKEFYITSNFLRCITQTSETSNPDNQVLFNDIQELINNLTLEPNNKEIIHVENKSVNDINLNFMNTTLPQMDGLLNTLNTFMQNKEIMDITTELSSEIQSNNIDPMSMMNSLLSGNLNDSKFTSLLTKITDKISNKIENGDIDKNLLERHANDFMNQISSNSELMNLAKNFKK